MKRRILIILIPIAAVLLMGAGVVGVFPWKISSPSNGQVLAYNSTDGAWENQAASGGSHTITFAISNPVAIATGQQNTPIKVAAGGTIQAVRINCRPSGNVTLDFLRSANNGGLPTASIVGAGTKPNIASSTETVFSSTGAWTSTTVTANDNFDISVTAIDPGIQYISATITYQ